MNTIIRSVDKNNIDLKIIDEAINILRNGGLVAFPTETVYGLGANALDSKAAEKIYNAKGRPSDNPLIVHISDINDLEKIGKNIPQTAYNLAQKFWPGPLTMIVHKSEIIPYTITGGLDTVAVRMPSHLIAKTLISNSGLYIAAPSANTSGRPSPTFAKHVIEDMKDKIDMIIDGGNVEVGIESTIVDLTSDIPIILRPGYITKSQLELILGQVTIDKAILDVNSNEKPKAPGMKYRHYAPKGKLTIVEGNIEDVIKKINDEISKKRQEGFKTGVIATNETFKLYNADEIKIIGSKDNEKEIAKNLYDILRAFDECNVDFIYSESFRNSNLGYAIMNRLLKAAGYSIINI